MTEPTKWTKRSSASSQAAITPEMGSEYHYRDAKHEFEFCLQDTAGQGRVGREPFTLYVMLAGTRRGESVRLGDEVERQIEDNVSEYY